MKSKIKETIQRAKKLAETSGICHLATVDGRRPKVRAMAFVWRKDNEIWFSTDIKSQKVKHLKRNPYAQAYFSDSKGLHCRIDGECIISKQIADKRKQWKAQPELLKYFSGINDPAFVVLRFKPSRYEYMSYGQSVYDIAEIPE